MNKFLFGILLCVIVCSTTNLNAQTKTEKHTITVEAVDSTTLKGLEYATVSVTDSTMKVLNMGAADGNGKFNLDMRQKALAESSISSQLAK